MSRNTQCVPKTMVYYVLAVRGTKFAKFDYGRQFDWFNCGNIWQRLKGASQSFNLSYDLAEAKKQLRNAIFIRRNGPKDVPTVGPTDERTDPFMESEYASDL